MTIETALDQIPDRRKPRWREVGAIGRLAGPLIIAMVSQTGMGLTDTLMAGRLGAVDLAAVAMGSILWMPVFLFYFGIINALSPTIAHQVGAGDEVGVGASFRQGLWLAGFMGVLAVPTTYAIAYAMEWVGTVPEVAELARGYLYAVAWGMPAACLYLAPRFFSEAIGHTRPVMYIGLAGLVLNGFADYALMFGAWGAPRLGAVGCGVATAIVLWFNLLAMLVYLMAHQLYRRYQPFSQWSWPDWRQWASLARLGLPISLGILSEVGMFAMITLLMSSLSATAIAAHQIALNYASIMFMVPLALGMGIVIRVGHRLGQGDPLGARRAALTGIGMAATFMSCSLLAILLLREKIVTLYTDVPEVLALAEVLLLFAAAFQISDGLNISIVHALRGFKDTTVPMFLGVFAFWCVGLGAGYYLGILAGFGPRGLWVGLILGLSCSALLGAWRLRVMFRRALHKPG